METFVVSGDLIDHIIVPENMLDKYYGWVPEEERPEKFGFVLQAFSDLRNISNNFSKNISTKLCKNIDYIESPLQARHAGEKAAEDIITAYDKEHYGFVAGALKNAFDQKTMAAGGSSSYMDCGTTYFNSDKTIKKMRAFARGFRAKTAATSNFYRERPLHVELAGAPGAEPWENAVDFHIFADSEKHYWEALKACDDYSIEDRGGQGDNYNATQAYIFSQIAVGVEQSFGQMVPFFVGKEVTVKASAFNDTDLVFNDENPLYGYATPPVK